MLKSRPKYDIYERTFKFAAQTIGFVKKLRNHYLISDYIRQLIRSSGSIGANMQEADGALTKRDFVHKLGIARKESLHWLRLINEAESLPDKDGQRALDDLIKGGQNPRNLTFEFGNLIFVCHLKLDV